MLLLDDPIVNVAVSRQSQVAVQPVSSNGTSWLHDIADEATQVVRCEIADHPHPRPTNTPTILLDRNDHQRFVLRPTPNVPFFRPANVGFIDLDPLLKAVASRANHGTTQLVKPGPGGFIAPQPQGGLAAQRHWPPFSDWSPTTWRGTTFAEASWCPGRWCPL